MCVVMQEPTTGSDLRFHGIEAYDAAVHCASVAAPRPTTVVQPLTPTSSSHSSGARLAPRAPFHPQHNSAPQTPESTAMQSPFATARTSAAAAAALPTSSYTPPAADSATPATPAASQTTPPPRRSADRGTNSLLSALGNRLVTDPNLPLSGTRAAAVQRWVDAPSVPDINRESVTAAMLAASSSVQERNHRMQARAFSAEQQAAGQQLHNAGQLLQQNGGVTGAGSHSTSSLPSVSGSSRSSRSSSNSLTSPHSMAEQSRTQRDSRGSSGGCSTPPALSDGCVWPWQSSNSALGRVDGGDGERESLRGRSGSRSMPLPAMHAPTQNGLMDRLVGMVKRYRTGGSGQ